MTVPAYGQGLADVVEKVSKEKGVRSWHREFTNDKATDFNAILTKVRGGQTRRRDGRWHGRPAAPMANR